MSSKETGTCTCFICGRKFEWGHGNAYKTGRKVAAWGEMVCAACDQRDGIFPDQRLIARLKAKEIVPSYNSQDFIIIPT